MKYLPKILLVDDEKDFISISSAILRKKGFDVYSIFNGHEVFPIVKSYKPDLILLDVKLSDHDGRIICRQLKDDPGTKDIKIILHSAFPDVGVEYQRYGADEFLLKPYSTAHLISRINYHLK